MWSLRSEYIIKRAVHETFVILAGSLNEDTPDPSWKLTPYSISSTTCYLKHIFISWMHNIDVFCLTCQLAKYRPNRLTFCHSQHYTYWQKVSVATSLEYSNLQCWRTIISDHRQVICWQIIQSERCTDNFRIRFILSSSLRQLSSVSRLVVFHILDINWPKIKIVVYEG